MDTHDEGKIAVQCVTADGQLLKPRARMFSQVVEGRKELLESLVKGASFVVSKGVADAGAALWINGMLVAGDEVSWQHMLPFQLHMEQQRIQVTGLHRISWCS
jgi:hypothetical protein